jgi:anti-anti-sigma factor
MDLDIQIPKSTARFVVSGPIDTEGGKELTAKFMEIVGDPKVKDAIFDLTEVPSISSAGIGKLLAFAKLIGDRGGAIRIQGISDTLRKQFSEIHMDKIVPIE